MIWSPDEKFLMLHPSNPSDQIHIMTIKKPKDVDYGAICKAALKSKSEYHDDEEIDLIKSNWIKAVAVLAIVSIRERITSVVQYYSPFQKPLLQKSAIVFSLRIPLHNNQQTDDPYTIKELVFD